jgi:hypothetical protein
MQGFHHILLDVCKYLMMQSSIWQMVHTRTFEELSLDSPKGYAGRGHGQVPRGGAPPPPPRPPVSLEQLLATQNDLMRRLIENDECRGAERQQPQHQERDCSYSDFPATHPLVFNNAIDPLEVDNWLCKTESKFGLLYCTEYQKTLYAAQQLRGVAGAWWVSYIATLPDDHHVPWDEFHTAFHAHHLSAGLLRSKLKEFLDLEQGNHSVFDYTRQLNTLAQYGTYHVNTVEKKANMYHAGLTIHLQERLVHLSSLSYNKLASAAIDQERMMKAVTEADEKKRKRVMHGFDGNGSSSGVPSKYRMVYTPPGGQLHRPQQQQNWAYRPQFQPQQFQQQQQQFNHAPTPLPQQAAIRPPQQFPASNFPCFNSGKMGHFTRECHLPKQSNSL